MDGLDEGASVGEGSPESADGDTTDTQTSQDPSNAKNRSKRKPSKTQIKHIAPKDNCDTSKYGTQNMEDLFNDVTQGIYRSTQSQLALQLQPLIPQSVTPVNTQAAPTVPKRIRRLSQTSAGSTSSIRSLSRPPPSYPCGICGKVFRVPSRYDSHMLGHSKGKPFCCNTCGKMFSSQDKLDHHLPVHNTDRKASFTCESCGKVCVNWRAYLYHLKAKHTESGGKRFACNICGRQFHTGQRLRNHMASHEVGKNHCCSVCGKLFESGKKLDTHIMVHNLTSKHDQNLQCSDCGRQYSEWIAFKQHMKTHGAEGVQYPCGLCEKVFPTQYEKEKHKRVHKQVQCEFCERYFRSASVLSVHLRIHTGERPYKCGLCERDFSQASVLKVHMRTHRKEGAYDCKRCGQMYTDVMEFFKHHMAHLEEGNLQCEECGKMFESINNKNRHMAAHRDRAGRICQICGKEFGRVSHLEAHMLCHSNQLPLLCKVCGKMFPSEEVLTAHYSTHMGNELNSAALLPPTKGPLFCGLCGKMFKGQVFLNNHMKKHEREGLDSRGGDDILDEDVVEVDGSEFSCSDCGKTFEKKHHLTVHRREHTGERPHTCILCGQSFSLRKLLLEHISDHKRAGIMMFTSQESSMLNCDIIPRPSDDSYLDSDTCSETESDHEESENTHLKHQPQHIKYEHSAMSLNSIPIQNSSFQENQFPKQLNSSYTEKSYVGSHNSYSEKLFVDTPNGIYQDKHYSRPAGTPYSDKNFAASPGSSYSDKSFMNNSHTPATEKNFATNSTGSYTQSSDNTMMEKRYLESPNPIFPDKSYIENRKMYLDDNIIKKSPVHSSDDLHPYGVSRHPYGLTLQSSSLLSNDQRHSSLQDGAFSQPDIHMAHDTISSGMPFSLKDSSLHTSISMLRSEPHLSTNIQMSARDMGTYTFSYNSKAYLPSSLNSLQRNSFHGGFHGASGRFAADTQLTMSSFQLLPQTAFPENSHPA